MQRGLQEWVEYLLATPGEKYDLSSIARHHPDLAEFAGDIDLEPSFRWSGELHGAKDIVDNIIETQKYDLVPDNVMPISGGTSMAIFLACMALLRPGDEVVCQSPGWQQVPSICKRMNIRIKEWDLRSEDNWQPDTDKLKELVTPATKLIYINFPHNPTGCIIDTDKMAEICNIASRYGAYVLSDEINRGLEWDENLLSPCAANLYKRSISAASMSKSFGATGIRYGWFATKDKKLYGDCYDIYYNSFLCNNHPSEIIARSLLKPENYSKLMKESIEIGKKNLDFLHKTIEENEQWSWTPPGGSFSCFLKYHTGELSWDFFKRMINNKPIGVEFVPGSCFSEKCEYHVRIGFGNRHYHFTQGLNLLIQSAG